MYFLKNKFNFLILVIFLSSCSTMNVTQEQVSSGKVKTVKATSSAASESFINYDSRAVFANATIYFEFDKSNALDENDSISITLSGHADERGTREYNLALGQRRAETVSDYLVLNGINKRRITVKSYGEEKPAVLGQDESSYAKNRRVEIN